jgi:hypothetical protein
MGSRTPPPEGRAIFADLAADIRAVDAKYEERHRLEAAFLAECEPFRVKARERYAAAEARHDERLARRRERDARRRGAAA